MRNATLEAAMRERGLTQMELAELMNDEIEALTGKRGEVCDRTVRHWLRGDIRRPHAVRSIALEAVFERTITELGFVPRGRPMSSLYSGLPEDYVKRRRFFAAAVGTTTAAASISPPPRVGSSDIERLQAKFAALVASDHRHGGSSGIESQAVALAARSLELQQHGTVSQRIRCALYGCAASFTSSAMWAAIDGRRFDAALGHLDRAARLAALSGDSAIQFRIWSHAGSLYRHLGRLADALAANDVARSLPISRRDPVFASLGHARQAAIYGAAGNAQGAHRALGCARDSLSRATRDTHRPVWLNAVANGGEIEELAVSTYLSLGKFEQAETHAHRSLALLAPGMQRDRAVVSTRLAQAQLGQGDLESAVATAMSVPSDVCARHARVVQGLRDFSVKLRSGAGGTSHLRVWNEYVRSLR